MNKVDKIINKRAKQFAGMSQPQQMAKMRKMLSGGMATKEINYWSTRTRSTRLMYLRMAGIQDVRYSDKWESFSDKERRVLRGVIRDHLEHGRIEYEALRAV